MKGVRRSRAAGAGRTGALLGVLGDDGPFRSANCGSGVCPDQSCVASARYMPIVVRDDGVVAHFGIAVHMKVLRTDVAIMGGGLGACAAALGAARLGRRVILAEETHWVGGQLTNQAVPPDEHPWIEEFGATASYRTLRREIRNYYRAHVPLTAEARANPTLNPGNGWVSRLCHDPRVAVAVLHQMMMPHQLNGRLFVMHPQRPISAWTHGDRVTGVVVRSLESGRDSLIEAPFFIDATPYGD